MAPSYEAVSPTSPTSVNKIAHNASFAVLSPQDSLFEARQDSYWSRTAAVNIQPKCILQPTSAQQVSEALKRLNQQSEYFAVRSGGHMPGAGSNNIVGGVTIDLGRMDWTRFDAASETVDIGPGARWLSVYTELQRHGRVVAGGRDGNVGVAGLLLGGGISYFTARHGFGCDNVIAYEVVLADGRIVTADAENHVDLFRALKGGCGNFGIVTNFRMRTFRSGKAWGGITFYPKEAAPEAVTALVEFTDKVESDPDSNLLCFFAYAEFEGPVICTVLSNVAGETNAQAYEKWFALPTIQTTCKTSSLVDMLTECSVAPLGYFNTFHTACFKNDARIVTKAVELHDTFIATLQARIPAGDFISQCLFQPLPLLFARQSAAQGTINVMGLDRQTEHGLILTVSVMVKTQEDSAFISPEIKAWVDALQRFAAEINGNQDWVYANYADTIQDPIASYGAENVAFLRDVAGRYDPDGMFQSRCPGGFKLPVVLPKRDTKL